MFKEELKDVALLSLREWGLRKRERLAKNFPTYPETSNRNEKKVKIWAYWSIYILNANTLNSNPNLHFSGDKVLTVFSRQMSMHYKQLWEAAAFLTWTIISPSTLIDANAQSHSNQNRRKLLFSMASCRTYALLSQRTGQVMQLLSSSGETFPAIIWKGLRE